MDEYENIRNNVNITLYENINSQNKSILNHNQDSIESANKRKQYRFLFRLYK